MYEEKIKLAQSELNNMDTPNVNNNDNKLYGFSELTTGF